MKTTPLVLLLEAYKQFESAGIIRVAAKSEYCAKVKNKNFLIGIVKLIEFVKKYFNGEYSELCVTKEHDLFTVRAWR